MSLSKKKMLSIKNINESSLSLKDLKWISKELNISVNELLDSDLKLVIVENKGYAEKLARLILICINLYIILFIIIYILSIAAI